MLKRITIRRRLRTVVGVIASIAVLAGCGGLIVSEGHGDDEQQPPSTIAPVSGGTEKQRSAVEKALALVNSEAVTAVEILPAAEVLAVEGAAAPEDEWIVFAGRADDGAAATGVLWQAGLVASEAVRDVGDTDGRLAGYSIEVSGPNADVLDRTDVTTRVEADAPSPELVDGLVSAAQSLADRFVANASLVGATVESVKVYPLPALAVELTISVTDATNWVAESGERLSTLLGDDRDYDARLVRVLDDQGESALVASYNHLTWSGHVWVASGLSTDMTYADPVTEEDLVDEGP